MGKILATLRQNGPVEANPFHSSEVTGPALAELEATGAEEMPYIEIGPRRGVIDGSPGVMATVPPAPATQPASGLARPHSVRFRNLSAAGGAELAPELVAYHAPGLPAAAEYGELLTALCEAARRRGGARQALLFTAARPETGCTTVLLNVAITAARQGLKVVVVDANLRRPGVARKLGLSDAPGLAELLAGDCTAEEALRETAVDNLTALTAGAPVPFLADLAALGLLVDELRHSFEVVLVDGPRWDGRAACVALAKMSAAAFLVVPSAEADGPPASELLHDLPARGIALAGCVLTNP